MNRNVQLWQGGLLTYAEGLKLQAKARERVLGGGIDGALVLMEHYPVITAGRSGGKENLLLSPGCLGEQGVDFVESDRGGNVTCHSPGQLVGYPVLNLSLWQEDVHWYVNRLEEILIRTLRKIGVVAERKSQYTGVWIGNKKVAAIGVAVRRWVTWHGFALNISNDLALFKQIVPCGIKEFGVTSLSEQGLNLSMEEIRLILVETFAEIFDTTIFSEKEA